MKVMSVVGARPQFVKLAPIAAELARNGHEHVIVHTGQHYDADMSDVFFSELSIPAPDIHLAVGSASHGVQTGSMLARLDDVIPRLHPDWVVVYGDTNSTLAGALAAVKLGFPVAHLEAGLRSFNRAMPEEHNRVLTDHASDLLLAPTAVASDHLTREGLADRTVVVGDVMTDVCLRVRDDVLADGAELPEGIPAGDFVVATIHRAENTDDPARLRALLERLDASPVPVVLTAHPRLVERSRAAGVPLGSTALTVISPLSYRQMVATMLQARGVVTDSGGLQKEAFLLGVPCTTLRSETEWVETLEDGWNVLDPQLDRLRELAARPASTRPRSAPYGDGRAASRVCEVLRERSAGTGDDRQPAALDVL
jgi:UDP-N-acetylglucosamine 2-epimerase (non-hydrolysing)